jgi:hypothetical protein
VAVWWFFAGREQLCGGWRGGPWYGRRPCPAGAGPYPPEQRIDFHDREALTVCADCEVFVITGSCGLAGTVALRVGLRVRKRSGSSDCRRKPQPSGTRPSGTPAQNAYLIGRHALAAVPMPHRCDGPGSPESGSDTEGLVRVHFRGQRTLLRHQTQH